MGCRESQPWRVLAGAWNSISATAGDSRCWRWLGNCPWESNPEPTEVGAEVGTRNVVDVVLAQRTLFQARRDYANARYQYIINTLNLKQSAGVLSPEDVAELNDWLQ